MYNISNFKIEDTAFTNKICAEQRAINLSILGATNILELCVGPSLPILSDVYSKYGMTVTGNDIDPRYQIKYKNYKWIIGDCFSINSKSFDCAVFAPPLSKGCSGKRNDALSFWEITPSYENAINILTNNILCLVFPGKTLSIKEDKKQLYKFLSKLDNYEICPLSNKVVKYIDVYIKRNKIIENNIY